jgi:hypothetical protein
MTFLAIFFFTIVAKVLINNGLESFFSKMPGLSRKRLVRELRAAKEPLYYIHHKKSAKLILNFFSLS